MSFPASLPSYIITTGSESANTAGGGTGLSPLLNAFETDITAIGTKLGTGATTPAANQILFGTGAGTSAWQGLTSAQLLAVMSDETGSGSLVFGNSPTIVTPTIASFTNAQHDHTNAAGGGALGTNSVTTASITAASVSAAKMKFGMIRQRQGSTTGDASWYTGGTSATDTSAKDVFFQAGTVVCASSATVTFPTAFTQVPIVLATVVTAGTQNAFVRVGTISTTQASIQAFINNTTGVTSETVAWLAIGQ